MWSYESCYLCEVSMAHVVNYQSCYLCEVSMAHVEL